MNKHKSILNSWTLEVQTIKLQFGTSLDFERRCLIQVNKKILFKCKLTTNKNQKSFDSLETGWFEKSVQEKLNIKNYTNAANCLGAGFVEIAQKFNNYFFELKYLKFVDSEFWLWDFWIMRITKTAKSDNLNSKKHSKLKILPNWKT